MKVSPIGNPRSIAVGTVIAGVPATAAGVVDTSVVPSPLTRAPIGLYNKVELGVSRQEQILR